MPKLKGVTMAVKKIPHAPSAKVGGVREGRAVSSKGILALKVTTPKKLDGAGSPATNPEQLLAAG
jgi:organic hydroperoxide reductase OsmC/OhrA